MDSSEINENVCRICLDYNVVLNWNAEMFESYGMSYKDCYYKYIKLSESDSEGYPTDLCEMCANELKNAHMLFEKALESFNILRNALTAKYIDTDCSDTEVSNDEPKMQCNIYTDDENSIEFKANSPIDDTLTEIEDEICFSPVYEYERLAETENEISAKEIPMSEDAETEHRYFIDIQSLYPSPETSLQQQVIENNHSELPNLSATKNINKRKTYKISSEQRLGESCDSTLTKSSPTQNSDSNISDCCDTESPVPSKTKRNKPPMEKICQYCSMKVKGTTHLRTHEATHLENRERNETCPQCGIKLYRKETLNEHMKIHDENRQKKHKCEFCEKAFFNKGGLNVHRRIHLGQMVKCKLCLKEFFRQIDLDKHLLKHSASPLERNVGKVKYTIQCQYCNKAIWTNKWKAHKAQHLNQPQMKCKICDKTFFCRANCTNHLRKTHRKRDYDKYIHYYVDSYSRMSHLMMTQQESVQALTTPSEHEPLVNLDDF